MVTSGLPPLSVTVGSPLGLYGAALWASELHVDQVDDEDQSVADLDSGLRVAAHRVVAVLARHGNQHTAALALPHESFAESRNDLRQAEGNRSVSE